MNNTFKEHELLLNELLADYLNSYIDNNSVLKSSMVYSLLDGGKRIRPTLFKLILDHYNVDYKDYVQVMQAVEMIHTYSLVHDDLPAMDNDLLRRGKPTTHVRFDEAIAILCGDALLTDSFGLLSNIDTKACIKIELIKILSSKSGSNGMVYGQILDMYPEGKDVDTILKTYYHKTCNLIQASLMMAGVIVDLDVNKLELLGEYLGIAFQIQDDILEYTKSSEELGKSNTSDIDNDKKTVVSFIGLDKANELVEDYHVKLKELINELGLSNSSFEDYLELIFKRQY
ncbi:MAG: polyprenyl synthetase family protein [Erysipelotrichales bacterium]